MPFARFVREAEPHKVSCCSNCGVELKRHKLVWLLLTVGALVAALSVAFAGPFAYARWGAGVSVLVVLIIAVATVSGIKLCGWLLIGWEPAGPEDGRA
jgi:hypothetical protein